MEILLLLVIVIVAAAGLFVAVTFNKRTRENFTPLMESTEKIIVDELADTGNKLLVQLQAISGELQQNKDVARRLQAASTEAGQQMQTVTDELRRNREAVRQLQAASAELGQQMHQVTGELQRNKELLSQLHERAGAQRNELGRDVTELDHRIAAFGESLAEQSVRISGIYRYVALRETPAVSSADNGSLLLAMLEAESYVDSKGWGGPPHLYALTAPTSTVELRDIPEDALVIVEQERLRDADLAEALSSIHWPADVVGCVLVTELAALPPRSGEGADIDALTAEQWTSPHPDGRPARIAVAVGRGGEHQCGLRIKGDDELQVRTDLASDVVTALLATF
jgi:hypothetical protein